MTRGRFEQPSRGQSIGRIMADTWAGFNRAARNNREQHLPISRTNDPRRDPTATHFRVRNDHSADVDAFSVLEITGPIVEHSDREDEFLFSPSMVGSRPAATPDSGLFVITQEPIKKDKIGWAIAAGVSVVQIDVVDADHTFADARASDETKLKSADGGAAQILWKETGTGTKWGLVRLGNGVGFKPYVDFTLTAELTTSDASETATVQTQYGAGKSHPTAASAITVHNLRVPTASTYEFFGDSGDYGRAAWYDGTDFLILNMNC